MQLIDSPVYRARCEFQRMLDETFPQGAMCAVLEKVDGRLQAAFLLASTGRLFCSHAREAGPGIWEYEVLIDPRKTPNTGEDPVRLWIRGPLRQTTVAGLYQADGAGPLGQADRIVRFNADPPAHIRPSRRMRAAVTEAHEQRLFPAGIASDRVSVE